MRSCTVVLNLLVLWAAVAPAQLYVGADATLASPYVWRGLTRANVGALAPELFVTAELHGYLISAGRWWIYEPGATSQRLSDLPPGGMRFAESDWWVQGARRFGWLDASVGFIHYHYRDTVALAGRPSRVSTSEVYATLRASGNYLAPGLSAYWDVERVKGAYVEVFGAVPVFGSPLGQPDFWLVVGAVVGMSLGQEVNLGDTAQSASFARNGFTHLDLSVAFSAPRFLRLPSTVWQVEGHVQFSIDPFTQRISAEPEDAQRGARIFFKASVRWTRAVARW